METTILKLLDINKQFVEDSKSPKLSDKIVAHYYTLSEPAKQLHFKDALIQQLLSFSTVNDFTNFSHLLYAALAIKPPNLGSVLYKFLLNHKQLNQTFEGHNPDQLCLKILSQIPVNSVYVNNINQFFKNKIDESIGLHLFHFYAVHKLSNESLTVLSTICDNNLYMDNTAVLSFQLFTSLKYVDPVFFEVWLNTKLKAEQIPVYVLEVFRKSFERAEKSYPENWKEYLNRFIDYIKPYNKEKITVAFADRNQIFSQALEDLLKQQSSINLLFTTNSGAILLSKLEKFQPNVLLTDIRLEEIDGLTVTGKIKELYPEIKIIILSHYLDISTFKIALKAGADGYLSKEIAIEELHTAIINVTNGEKYFDDRVHNLITSKTKPPSKLVKEESYEMELIEEDEELKNLKESIEVKKRLRNLSLKLSKPRNVNEIEKEPAYKRRNTELTGAISSDESHHSYIGPSFPDNITKRELEVLLLIYQEFNNKEIADALFLNLRTIEAHKINLIRKLNCKSTIGLVKWVIKNNIELLEGESKKSNIK